RQRDSGQRQFDPDYARTGTGNVLNAGELKIGRPEGVTADEPGTFVAGQPPDPPPRLGDVYDDLVALETRFDDFHVHLAEHEIAVTTESITLEGIELGPFRLVWNWTLLGEDRALRVEALDPHPAAAQSDTTHPHVRDDALCTGDARQALDRAI